MSATAAGPPPLSGVRVLDFSRFQQGPYATLLLSDMGADVVRVERIGGEWDRYHRATPDGFSGFFYGLNRGKRSVSLDITTDAGRTAVLRMAEGFDVVVENFRPGVMDRLGLGYSALQEVNPRIIYAAAGGWGPDGPHREDPMYDMVAQAVTGVADFNSGIEGRPRLATRGYADAGGATFLAMGVLTALYVRSQTGAGQRVDASLVGACISLHAQELAVSLNSRHLDRPTGRVSPTSGAFRSSDGNWVVVAATDEKLWRPLCHALGRGDLLEDPRFVDRAARMRNRDELEPQLEQAFARHDREYWLSAMVAADVPVGPVKTFLDLPDDADVMANGYLVRGDDPRWGTKLSAGHPFHLSSSTISPGTTLPGLAEHTEAELLAAGFTGAEIDDLVAGGAAAVADGLPDRPHPAPVR